MSFFLRKIFTKGKGEGALSLFFLFFVLIVSGCDKPSFPKDKVIDSIKDICRSEYHVDDVQAKMSGNNLGAWVRIEKLFGGISDADSDRMGNVLLSLARVSLSTDAPVQFYTMVVANKAIPGVEYVATRYVVDIKKFWGSIISRDDFEQRMMLKVRFNPVPLAKRSVLNFFSDLSTGNTRNLLTDYLKKSSDTSEFSLSFLRMILEMKLKENVHFKVLKIKTKPLADEKALVYCQVKETYKTKPGTSAGDLTFLSGFIYEYLFVVGAASLNAEILEIIPLDYKDENGQLKKRAFPAPYASFQNVDLWSEDDFCLEEITLPDFIAGQIALRIVRKVSDLEKLVEDKKEGAKPLGFKVESVKGHYLKPDAKKGLPSFQFDFEVTQNNEDIPPKLYDLTVEVLKSVLLEKYRFDDFDEIRLVGNASKDPKVISKNMLIQ